MEGVKPGQRLLLALASSVSDDSARESPGATFYPSSILIAVGGVMCLVLTLLMCTCKDSKQKNEVDEHALEDVTAYGKGGNKNTASAKTDTTELKVKTATEPVITNGGPQQSNSSTLPGHSRQASSGSAHNMRPTSLRELPEPPVSSSHAPTISGVERPNSYARSGVTNGSGDHNFRGNNSSGAMANGKTSTENKVKSNSDGYDHLGPKPSVKPTDYDSLADPESTDGETPISETGGASDGHYSQLERTYAVVKEVKAKSKLFDPYSRVKDKDNDGSDFYSQVSDDIDPYNQIGESDGAVSSSFIRQLREKRDKEIDPYSLLEGDSGGDWKTAVGAVGGAPLKKPATSSAQSPLSNSFAQQINDDVVDEYAVVQKTKSVVGERLEREGRRKSADEISPFVPPPEPPRLYSPRDEEGEGGGTFTVTTPSGRKKEHPYSMVTARESLASMSARNALNPYESVPDVPENTYATVEGGSGDGVVTRAMATGGNEENRLSQGSDTYAEIAISGGGLSTSVISTSSSTGNNNSSSSGAPVPPSLDSLHLMTKSQTSSEGDRLSDRHLASPEDSGLGLNHWGDNPNGDDSGASSEDGYSTLKRTEGVVPPHDHALPEIPGSASVTDQESGEVTLVPNYQTVKDFISDSEVMEEVENDPNYESVDETRAKVAALKAKDNSKPRGDGKHVSVVTVFRPGKEGENLPGRPQGNEDQTTNTSMRRRRYEHDYEEVDVSPPLSPSTTPSNQHPTTPSNRTPTSTPTTNSPPFMSASPSSSTPPSKVSSSKDLEKAKERQIQSHMYEELTVVRAKKSEMNKATMASKGSAKTDSEEKKKSGSNDKKKSSSEDKKKAEEKRKSNSEDKKKGGSDDKRKHGHEDKRKSGLDGTRL